MDEVEEMFATARYIEINSEDGASVEGRQFDCFFKLAFCVVPLMLVWALMRFFWLWAATKRLLRRRVK